MGLCFGPTSQTTLWGVRGKRVESFLHSPFGNYGMAMGFGGRGWNEMP